MQKKLATAALFAFIIGATLVVTAPENQEGIKPHERQNLIKKQRQNDAKGK